MQELLTKINFSKVDKFILVASVSLLLGYYWFSSHVWFRIDDHKITINQRSIAEGSDYSCFKSLSGNIFCHHQDHGTQYLVSPKTNEIFVISENADVSYLERILFSATFSNTFDNAGNKQKLPDKITEGKNFIQFTPSIAEWKSQEAEFWRIYN